VFLSYLFYAFPVYLQSIFLARVGYVSLHRQEQPNLQRDGIPSQTISWASSIEGFSWEPKNRSFPHCIACVPTSLGTML